MGYTEEWYFHEMNFDKWNLESLEELVNDLGGRKFQVKGKEIIVSKTLPSDLNKIDAQYPHSKDEIDFFNVYKIYCLALQAYESLIKQQTSLSEKETAG